MIISTSCVLGILFCVSSASPAKRTELKDGDKLHPGDSIYSPNGQFQLQLQDDGDLAVKAGPTGNVVMWHSKTQNRQVQYLKVEDGYPVLRDFDGKVIWCGSLKSRAGGKLNKLAVTDEGNLEGYNKNNERIMDMETSGKFSGDGATMYVGATLLSGSYLRSLNGKYYLQMQGDGNLVLKKGWNADKPISMSRSQGVSTVGLYYQYDGNFVIYEGEVEARHPSNAKWASETSGPGKVSEYATLTDDGRFLAFDANGKQVAQIFP